MMIEHRQDQCPSLPSAGVLTIVSIALTTVLTLAACSGATIETTSDEAPAGSSAGTILPDGERTESGDPVTTVDPSTTEVVAQPTPTTSTTISPAEEAASNRAFDPLFEPILDRLAAASPIPPRLPADLGLETDDDEIQATLAFANESGYLIYVGFGECSGGNVCRIASFSGSVDEVDVDLLDFGVEVPLPGGIRGTFHDATCGANCGDGFVAWPEGNVVYTVGRKVGTGPDMLEWAEQSIDAAAAPADRPQRCGPNTVRDGSRAAALVDGADSLVWITTCSEDGIEVGLASGPGVLTWVDIDGDGDNDLARTDASGTVELWTVTGIQFTPVIDFGGFGRLTIVDLRCMDLTGDGRPELVDAADGSVIEFINPGNAVRNENAVDGADTFDRCF